MNINRYILFLILIHFYFVYFIFLCVYFFCPQKKRVKRDWPLLHQHWCKHLLTVFTFFIKCLLSVMNVFICLILFSLKSSLCARWRVFGVWVHSVGVTKSCGSFSNLWRFRHEECISLWSVHHKHTFVTLVLLKHARAIPVINIWRLFVHF